MGEERTWRSDLESVMCLVAAVIMGFVGYLILSDLYLLEHRGEVVSATVLDKYSDGGGSRIEVRFVTRTGETVLGDTTNYVDAEVGETIQIVYDRENPGRMQAADYGFDYWLPGGIFGGVAVFFIVWGLRGLCLSARQRSWRKSGGG